MPSLSHLRSATWRAGAAGILLSTACGSDGGGVVTPGGGIGVASVQITAPATSVVVNSTLSLSAVARDSRGALASGVTIAWSSSAAGIASVSSAGVVLGVSAGSAVISASVGTVSSTVVVTVTPDDTPASLTILTASPAVMVSGVSQNLSVAVRTADGRVLAAPQVTLVSSDPNVASVSGVVITAAKAGTAMITATSGAATASITVTVTPGPPALLAVRTQPTGTTVGAPLTTQPVIEVTDRAGNVVNAQLLVTARISSGGGTLFGASAITSAAGVATFTDLAVIGLAGTRTLLFVSSAVPSVPSSSFALAASPTPLLALDSTALAFTVPAGRQSSVAILGVQNGSDATTVLSLGAPTYDAGQPTGWLIASLAASAPPTSLSIQAVATSLPPGSYKARVAVAATGATNSPLVVTVSLSVLPSTVFTFGSATDKLRVLDVGATFAPSLSARDGGGQTVPTGPVSYVSRATTVATVDAQGVVTARGEGQTWVAVIGATTSDSVHIIVPKNASGPLLRSDAGTFVVAPGAATFINVLLDTRGTPVGAATVAVGYTTATGVFNSVTWTVPAGPPAPVANSPLGGVVRVSIASATPLTGQLALLRLRVVAPREGTNGVITLTITDIVAPDGSDLASVSTSTRIPVIVQ